MGRLYNRMWLAWRRPSRIQIAWARRSARRSEARIHDYPFPEQLEARVRTHFPELGTAGWELVERGLREWFVCCAWRGWALLGMPSRVVDEAWHEFILDSKRYSGFCDVAYGYYLHHVPDETTPMPMPEALASTVISWDRSEWGREEESVLWDLDRRLGIEEPHGLDRGFIESVRAAVPREVDGWLAGFGGTAVAGVGFAMVDPATIPAWVPFGDGSGYLGCGGGGGCGGGSG